MRIYLQEWVRGPLACIAALLLILLAFAVAPQSAEDPVPYHQGLVGSESKRAAATKRSFRSKISVFEVNGKPADNLGKPDLMEVSIDDLIGHVTEWAESDFGAATRWAAEIQDQERRNQLLTELARIRLVSAPDEAMTLLRLLPGTVSRDDLLSQTLRHWAKLDSDSCARWLETPYFSDQESMKVAFALELAQTRPWDAAMYVANLKPGPEQDRAALSVAARWSHLDQPAAAEWIAAMPDSDLKDCLSAMNATFVPDPVH